MKQIIVIVVMFMNFCSSYERNMSPSSRKMDMEEGELNRLDEYSSNNSLMKTASVSKQQQDKTNLSEKTIQKRMMIYNANITLQSKEIEPKIQEILKILETYNGYAISTNTNGILQLKVPSESLRNFLNKLKDSAEQYSEELSAKDVTEEYMDIAISLENSRKLRERMIELLSKAKNLEEILKVEAEINKVTDSIDRLEGKLKYLSSNISHSTVNIRILRKYEPYKEVEYKPGPLGIPFYYAYKGIVAGWNGLVWLFVQEEEPMK